RSKNKAIVEYALRDVQKPIGISTHSTAQNLPDSIEPALPTREQFAQVLNTAELSLEEAE
ncbi:MAG: DUF1016 domain-containing protein, partial [Cyanobacteria bacterium P01_C01_bin.70]